MSSLIVIALLVIMLVIVVKLARVLNERDSALAYAAYCESLVDQWAAYAASLERDNAITYDSLFAYSAKHANGNRGQLPLVVESVKSVPEHVTDIDGNPVLLVASAREFTTRGGKVIAVPLPVKAESKSGDNGKDNGKGKHGKHNGKGGKDSQSGALPTNESQSGESTESKIELVEEILGDRLDQNEANKVKAWESGKGKNTINEYAKRIQGMRKGGK